MATRWRSPPDNCWGAVVGAVAEADAVQRLHGQRSPVLAAHAGVEQAGGDVLGGGQGVGEVELLEHEPEPAAAQRRQAAVGQ
ncbi:hypothetical protein GCM10010178_00780 [Lentzea flava]|uniref:Uncharacterized protein n=1 Tax=Lentzea flava TaxID=103732 RepID=A0ABQ2U904_9PSEU|nr:hypothetical protein GCM10010178_00780 [Lentzea flava]